MRAFGVCAAMILLAACATVPAGPAPVPEAYRDVPLFESGGAIVGPQVVSRVEPLASSDFRATRTQARASVEAVIDTEGNVIDAWYTDGDRQWAQSLIDALRRWKFKPATLDGQPIMVRFKLTSTYRSNM